MKYLRCGFYLPPHDAGYYDGLNGNLPATHEDADYLAGYNLGQSMLKNRTN